MFHFWRRAEDSTSIVCIFIRIPQTFLETLNATFHVLTHQAKKKKIAFVVSQNANVIFVSNSIKRPSMNEHVILADQIIFLVLLIHLPIVMAASGVDRPSKYHNRHEVTNEAKNTDCR